MTHHADVLTYSGAHQRVRRMRGAAVEQRCTTCSRPARQWAAVRERCELRAPNGAPYSVDPANYQPMCLPCHKAYDLAHLPPIQQSTWGEAHWSAKLADQQADELRRAYTSGLFTTRMLAEVFGVTNGYVSRLGRRHKRVRA